MSENFLVNMAEINKATLIKTARRTFEVESRALALTVASLDESAFVTSCELILSCKGHVIVTGIGKSGHIARKIASTLSSTGTPALFLHPAEAGHGDMGAVKDSDVVIVISKSGESDELFAILPGIQSIKIPIIAITEEAESKLGKAAIGSGGTILRIVLEEEACPLDLAPTSSTTASLVFGDALAMALLEARNFSPDDFAKLHPAGALGRRLTLHVRDLMVTGAALPVVAEDANLAAVMMEMSAKRLGATTVQSSGGKTIGIITDGDLRRYFQSHLDVNTNSVVARDIMTIHPRTTTEDILAIEALRKMENGTPKVMHLLVLGSDAALKGIIHLHDIVRSGIS